MSLKSRVSEVPCATGIATSSANNHDACVGSSNTWYDSGRIADNVGHEFRPHARTRRLRSPVQLDTPPTDHVPCEKFEYTRPRQYRSRAGGTAPSNTARNAISSERVSAAMSPGATWSLMPVRVPPGNGTDQSGATRGKNRNSTSISGIACITSTAAVRSDVDTRTRVCS